jgi:membrane-associated protease RseP (regulator of RpoE activity)
MKEETRRDTWSRLLLILLLLLPLAVLFLLPGGGFVLGAFWFWLALLLCWLLIWRILGRPKEEMERIAAAREPRPVPESDQSEPVREVMNVREATEEAGVQVYRGSLRESASAAFDRLKRAFTPGTVPLLQEDKELGAAILLLPKPVEERRLEKAVRPWLHWLLFALTILTTTWAGAAHQGVNLLREPERFTVGLPYSLALMAILGIHELGHYFMARRHGIKVTPPFFIPVPFALGTFGAFIQMRSPTENRRALFDVAVAGPLAGLLVAIPALLVGLQTSTILPADRVGGPGFFGGTSAGSSLLFGAAGEALAMGYAGAWPCATSQPVGIRRLARNFHHCAQPSADWHTRRRPRGPSHVRDAYRNQNQHGCRVVAVPVGALCLAGSDDVGIARFLPRRHSGPPAQRPDANYTGQTLARLRHLPDPRADSAAVAARAMGSGGNSVSLFVNFWRS